MEKSQRAGIATFVMRDREYLVAIFARNGILCAETLRFHDEVRDPRTIGLPESADRPASSCRGLRASSRCACRQGDRCASELADRDDRTLRALINKKKRAGKDVLHTSHEDKNIDQDDGGDVDLLDVIRQEPAPCECQAMSLNEYRRKRHFDRTAEPEGRCPLQAAAST